jgi:mannose-6-phosphate isomerase-like protein (cupin superfamily)
MDNQITVDKALQLVAQSGDKAYGVPLRHGTMELGFYKPTAVDPQTPHTQDEIYIVQSGSGYFVIGEQRMRFATGDALFVPAGAKHRFEEFSEDFAAWVVFYGPEGGE